MRVLLDTTFARRGPSGTGVYIERLAAALAAEQVDVVEAWNHRRGTPGGGGLRSAANLAGDEWWTRVGLARAASAAAADVIHHPLPGHALTRRPQVVTVHDLAFVRLPDLFDRRYAAYAARAHRDAVRRAGAVVCVSEATRRDLLELWGVDGLVAHHGPGQAPATPPPRQPPRHFLYVGDDEPRKDLGTLRAAHAQLGAGAPPLVLAGSAGGRAPTAAELIGLHAAAIALVHPARSEGFGLTVLEAMALGTPVIAARCPAVEEVGGDAIRYFEPGDAAGLAGLMGRLAADPDLREGLGAAGRRRAAGFSWGASARRHIEAYTLACR